MYNWTTNDTIQYYYPVYSIDTTQYYYPVYSDDTIQYYYPDDTMDTEPEEYTPSTKDINQYYHYLEDSVKDILRVMICEVRGSQTFAKLERSRMYFYIPFLIKNSGLPWYRLRELHSKIYPMLVEIYESRYAAAVIYEENGEPCPYHQLIVQDYKHLVDIFPTMTSLDQLIVKYNKTGPEPKVPRYTRRR